MVPWDAEDADDADDATVCVGGPPGFSRAMKLSLPVLLSVNDGYVDSAGFLALRGLFSGHVAGNFVTLGAATASGGGGKPTAG